MDQQINPLALVAQLDNVRKQIIIVQEQINRIESTKLTLQNLKEIKDKKELIVNIGESVFIRANVENINNVILELGESIFSEVSIDEALEILNKRQEKLKKMLENLLKLEEDLRTKVEEVYKTLQNKQQK